MTVKLPPMPPQIARLPLDARGYPVPWFVAWMKDGYARKPETPGAVPDFRILHPNAIVEAARGKTCWICGGFLGKERVFAIGPMCVVNRVTSEPPSHHACAEFAAKACPFLIQPKRRRNDEDRPEGVVAGIHVERNPGAICLYDCHDYQFFKAPGGVLIRLGAPEKIAWWAYGRQATRQEVLTSIDGGLPLLRAMASKDGPKAVEELETMIDRALYYLPQAA